ncbi:unnamed protein product [Echinostoma caproni]|uniref:SH2 domain-containing protein n=1 Tax=Echinostoma caproni TaxID=27848 RepID=A0A183A862_9TREM|nr:unnamed protein product [Echinostoma caproni]
MSRSELSQTEALLSESSLTKTLDEEIQTSYTANALGISPPCTVVQTQEVSSTDQSIKPVNRRTKASRWRTFHKDPVHLDPHSIPNPASSNKSLRQRWYAKFKRDYTSATNVSHVEPVEHMSADHRQISRIRSFRKLQRGVVVVHSDTNSRNSGGSVSKNYSLDSTKSDGLLNKTISFVGESVGPDTSEAPLEHYLPALTLTVPVEDVVRVSDQSQRTNTQCTTSMDHEEQMEHLCDYCALSQPTVSTGLLGSHNTLSPCVFRRHSHCGCSGSDGSGEPNAGSEQGKDVCPGNSETLTPRCPRCQRQTQHAHAYVSRNIYPPTRNRNASCSGIDMLADAILQTHSRAKGSSVESKTTSRDLFNLNRLRIIRRGEGKHLRNSLGEKFKPFPNEPCSAETTSHVSNIRPPMLVTPSVEAEEPIPCKDIQFNHRKDKKSVEVPTSVNSVDSVLDRTPGDHSHGTHYLKTKSIDSCTENSLKVPTLTQMFPKRTTTIDDEIPLDSRIRRVSMILLSRQHQAAPENGTTGAERKDTPTCNVPSKDEHHPLLTPPTVKSSSSRTRFLPPRQDTDNWSLTSVPRIDSPKTTKQHPAVLGSTIIPLTTTLVPTGNAHTISVGSSTTPNPIVIRPTINGNNDDDRVGKDVHMRYRRLRRPTERYSKGIGYHLGRRRHLLERRRRMADFSLAFGLFGIVAAFLDTELVARSLYSKTSIYSYGMRFLISLSTIVLLALIVSYHAYDVMSANLASEASTVTASIPR